MATMDLCISRAGLGLAIKKARVEHPQAYAKTILKGDACSQEDRRHFLEHGLVAFNVSLGYVEHARKAKELITLADPVLVISSSTYWAIEHANPRDGAFSWKGYEMYNVFINGRSAFITFEKGSVRGLCAPISECRPFRSMPSVVQALARSLGPPRE